MVTFIQFLYESGINKNEYHFHSIKKPFLHDHIVLALHKGANYPSHFGQSDVPDGYHPNNVVGFSFINNHRPDETAVHPDHRRKGVATGMYHHYERTTGHQLSPGDNQSDDAKAFWKSRKMSK